MQKAPVKPDYPKSSSDALRRTMDESRMACQVVGFDRRYVYVNATAARCIGRPTHELIGLRVGEAIPGVENTDFYAGLHECLERREPARLEHRIPYDDGPAAFVETRIDPVADGALIVSLDTTERRLRDAKGQHIEKMDLVSRLATGVAHDLNNLLTAIKGHAEVLVQEMALGEDRRGLRTDLEQIRKAATAAVGLTRQLAAFGRHEPVRARAVDLNEVVRGGIKMLDRFLSGSVEINTVLSSDMCEVHIDPSQLEQVLVQLGLSTYAIMPPGGRLNIATSPMRIESDRQESLWDVEPGSFAVLTVSALNARGDDPLQARVLEAIHAPPSNVYRALKRAGGTLAVSMSSDGMVTFKVYLPLAVDAQVRSMLTPSRSAAAEA